MEREHPRPTEIREITEPKTTDPTELLLGDRLLSDEEYAAIMDKVERKEPIIPADQLDAIVTSFQTPETINPMDSITAFAKASPEGAALMRTDLKLPRDCRHYEHIYSVVEGVDKDFFSLLHTDEERVIGRLTAFTQDIFKPMAVKATGSNKEQAAYNAIGIDNLLPHIDDSLLPQEAKEAVRQLVNQDFIGGALQGRFDSLKFESFKATFPEQYRHRLDTFMMVAYLADAGAHTTFRDYPDLENNGELRCSIPDDHDVPGKSLSSLFTRIPLGPVALGHPYRHVLPKLFPASVLAEYFADNHDAQPELGGIESNYVEAAGADGIWSAEFVVPGLTVEEANAAIKAFVEETHFPISAYLATRRDAVQRMTFVRDPSRSRQPSAPSIEECVQQATAFSEKMGWDIVQAPELPQPDVRACVGLLEGYDETEVKHDPSEALALLLQHHQDISVHTRVVILSSAAYSEKKQKVYEPYNEKVMVIDATAKRDGVDPLKIIADVAGNLKQQRIFAEVQANNRTVALSASSLN